MTENGNGVRTVGQHDLGGYGDGMQVLREGDALYVGHFGPSGAGTSILDASDPDELRLRQLRDHLARQVPRNQTDEGAGLGPQRGYQAAPARGHLDGH